MSKKTTAAFFLFLGYALALVPVYFLRAWANDESWFLKDAYYFAGIFQGQGFWRYFFWQESYLIYGAVYWIAYSLLAAFLAPPAPLLIFRALAYAACLAVPLTAAAEARRQGRSGLFVLLLWLTFPMAWWTGKISGPEFFSVLAGLAGCFAALRAERFAAVMLAAVLIGFSIGLKLNGVCYAVFAVAAGLAARKPRTFVPGLLLGCLIGFYLANPFMILHPEYYWLRVQHYSPDKVYSLSHIAGILWNQDWHWDAMFNGGFFNWGLNPPAFLWFLFLAWAAGLRRSFLAAWFLAAGTSFLMSAFNARYVGWYWFPAISLLLVLAQDMRAETRLARVLIAATLAANLAGNFPLIAGQYRSKAAHIRLVRQKETLQHFLRDTAAGSPDPVDQIVLDVETDLGLDFSVFPPPEGKAAAKVEGYDAFQWLAEGGAQRMDAGKKILVVQSGRFRAARHWPGLSELLRASTAGYETRVFEGPGIEAALLTKTGEAPAQ
ncbi:MAG TPA: hypothetical protein VL688_09130 [Verrucomicrobiae bacterium]|jgi:hypothetical protein|nr:hypothetical protein [Verrucomicrobiae bacterium]